MTEKNAWRKFQVWALAGPIGDIWLTRYCRHSETHALVHLWNRRVGSIDHLLDRRAQPSVSRTRKPFADLVAIRAHSEVDHQKNVVEAIY